MAVKIKLSQYEQLAGSNAEYEDKDLRSLQANVDRRRRVRFWIICAIMSSLALAVLAGASCLGDGSRGVDVWKPLYGGGFAMGSFQSEAKASDADEEGLDSETPAAVADMSDADQAADLDAASSLVDHPVEAESESTDQNEKSHDETTEIADEAIALESADDLPAEGNLSSSAELVSAAATTSPVIAGELLDAENTAEASSDADSSDVASTATTREESSDVHSALDEESLQTEQSVEVASESDAQSASSDGSLAAETAPAGEAVGDETANTQVDDETAAPKVVDEETAAAAEVVGDEPVTDSIASNIETSAAEDNDDSSVPADVIANQDPSDEYNEGETVNIAERLVASIFGASEAR